MVNFFNLRVRKACEKLNPPSYEDKQPNCSFPHCDENGACDLSREIIYRFDNPVKEQN